MVTAFRDIHPRAPSHILIIHKRCPVRSKRCAHKDYPRT
ncbi:HIT family hydrolase [Vibrio cholerae]|nr:HIT family hydrolase [Vibrio cholerae]